MRTIPRPRGSLEVHACSHGQRRAIEHSPHPRLARPCGRTQHAQFCARCVARRDGHAEAAVNRAEGP